METSEQIKDRNVLEFVVFCIENLASTENVDGEQVYRALQESGILHQYIIPEYEMLHTQSKDYILRDILEVMEERGVVL